ncbi:hypothetical protein BaRGS_00014587 [Batillaria attramentaria]|uniref:Uncharacterized protein n=1 Tax=Batillaria attramentaria TaxID=370345 RepID=A0ABD0L3I7_9CAEN
MLQENQWVTTSSAGGNSASDHLPVLTLTGIVCVGLLLVIPTIAQNPLAAFSSREGVSLDPRHGLLTWRYQTVCDCRDGASNFRSNCPPEIQVHVQQLRCPLGDQRQRSKGLLQVRNSLYVASAQQAK